MFLSLLIWTNALFPLGMSSQHQPVKQDEASHHQRSKWTKKGVSWILQRCLAKSMFPFNLQISRLYSAYMKRHTNVDVFKHMRFKSQYKHPCTKYMCTCFCSNVDQRHSKNLRKTSVWSPGRRWEMQHRQLVEDHHPNRANTPATGCPRKCWWKVRIRGFTQNIPHL